MSAWLPDLKVQELPRVPWHRTFLGTTFSLVFQTHLGILFCLHDTHNHAYTWAYYNAMESPLVPDTVLNPGYSQTLIWFMVSTISTLKKDDDVMEINNMILKFKAVISIVLDCRWDAIPWVSLEKRGWERNTRNLSPGNKFPNHLEIITKWEIREILSSEEGMYLKKNVTGSASSGQLVNPLHRTSGQWHTFLQITSAKWKLSIWQLQNRGQWDHTIYKKKESPTQIRAKSTFY